MFKQLINKISEWWHMNIYTNPSSASSAKGKESQGPTVGCSGKPVSADQFDAVTYHTYFLSSLYVRKEMWKARYINNKSQN
jgi:hypothetical protein